MLWQNPGAEDRPSLPLQLETDRTALSEDVASRSEFRFMRSAFGFAVLMLTGVSACALLALGSLASAEPSSRDATVAFIATPFLPAIAPGRSSPAIKDISEQQQRMQASGQPVLAKLPGGLQGSSPMMSSLLDRPMAGGSNSAVLDRPAPTPQRQYASPPTPPPPPGPGGGGGGGDGDGGVYVYLRRYSDAEALTVLDAWIARVGVYCLSEQFGDPEGLLAMHKANLEQLESFRSFAAEAGESTVGAAEQKRLYGLYLVGDKMDTTFRWKNAENEDKALAIAGGFSTSDRRSIIERLRSGRPSARNTLKITFMSVNPQERRSVPFAVPAMKQALSDLSKSIPATLDIDTQKEPEGKLKGS